LDEADQFTEAIGEERRRVEFLDDLESPK